MKMFYIDAAAPKPGITTELLSELEDGVHVLPEEDSY